MTDTRRAATASPGGRTSFRLIAAIAGLAFVVGLVAMGWAVSRWEDARQKKAPVVRVDPAALDGRAQPGAVPPPIPAPSAATAPPPDLAARLAQAEARIAALESTRGGAGGTSSRAEALLIAFAARRAIDRGLSLGYLEGELKRYYGETQPLAVGTIVAASRAGVTRGELAQELSRLTPALTGRLESEGWWQSFSGALSRLFVVRESGALPSDPEDRVARAQAELANGQVARAIAEISRLPQRQAASQWLAQARQHAEAQRALDILEAASLTIPAIKGATTPPSEARPPVKGEPRMIGPPDTAI